MQPSRNGNPIVEIHVLDRMQNFNPFLDWLLKGLASGQ